MDIDEAVLRFRANLPIVVVGLVVGLIIAGAFGLSRDPTYRASARLVVDAKEPRNVSDAKVIADTSRAIVGIESRVAAALRAAHAKRDAKLFAQNNVRIEAVGSSAVLELSVIDRNAAVAAAVSNSLADALIQARKQLADRRFADVLAELDQRIAVAAAQVQRSGLALKAAAGQRGVSPAAEKYREDVRHREDLESDRRHVFEDKAAVSEPAFIERAAVPSEAEPANTVADLVLGALLGLVLGVGIAAIRETLRPTVAGNRAITRLLGVPSVGTLSGPPGEADDVSLTAVGARLRLAAEASGVRKLALTSAGGPVDLDGFAKRLNAVIDGEENGTHTTSHDKRISWEVFSTEGESSRALRESPSTVGLVLVAPTRFKRRDLDGVMDLRLMSGWQLFGCVTYPRSRWGQPRPRGAERQIAEASRGSAGARRDTAPTIKSEVTNPKSVSLDEPSGSIVLDKTPSAAGVGRSQVLNAESLPPSATATPAPGAVNTRGTERTLSSVDEPAADRAAGPEGSLHWAPWGWQ